MVRIQGQISEMFQMRRGLKQRGCTDVLFNLHLEKINYRNTEIITNGMVFNTARQCLAYADDVIFEHSVGETWPFTDTDMMWMNLYERIILRCIYGSMVQIGRWRHYNEFKLLYNGFEIVADIRRSYSGWVML